MPNLICHYHEMAISQSFGGFILLSMLQTQDLLYVLNFSVVHYLLVVCLPDIQQFSPERKYTIVISPYDSYARHLQGRISAFQLNS